MSMSALPTCVALRSKHDGKSYLRCVHDDSYGGSLVELGHGDGGIMNPRARFFLEPSKEHQGLMHVRCCYNNKYWVPQERVLHGGSARWVIGTAHVPEEDLSKPECTLHKLIVIAAAREEEEGGSTCRFLHSKLGKYACVPSTPSTPIRSYMHIASHEDEADRQDGDLIDAFTVIDVSRQKQLPSYLAFKGDNGCFLVAEDMDGTSYPVFKGEDIGDSRALHTIFTNDDGVVRIRSNYSGLFWMNGVFICLPIIMNKSDDTTYNNPYTLFRVTTEDDFIALRNLGNNLFCTRLIGVPNPNLCPQVDSITTEARLQYYEPVLSRDIYDVDFRLSEARIHTKGIDDLYSQTVKNHTSTTNRTTLTFTYTSTVETTWSSTVSLTLGVKTTLECGIPFVAEGKIDISAEFSGSYTWGKTESEKKQTSKQITVDVPPMKKVTVNAIGSNGVCDIPFSYKQTDVLTNGQEVTKVLTDGMYYGVKTSNITFETIEEDL